MSLNAFIAGRFNNPSCMPRSIRIMRAVAGAGIAVAVASLVVSASVGAGFEREYKKALLDFNAHVIVMQGGEMTDYVKSIDALQRFTGASDAELNAARPWRAVDSALAWIESILDRAGMGRVEIEAVMPDRAKQGLASARSARKRQVRSVFPFLYREAMVIGPDLIRGVVIKGIDSSDARSQGGMKLAVEGGLGRLAERPGGRGGVPVLLGKAMADSMKGTDEGLRLVIPTDDGQRFVSLYPVGTFESGMHDYDSDFILMDIGRSREVFAAPADGASGLELRLYDPEDAEFVARAIEEGLGPHYSATTWGELNQDLLSAVRLERFVSAIIMGIMLVVAALNIISVLVLTTIRRTAEIAILKSIGLSERLVARLFVSGGVSVGGKGIAAGLAIGLAASILTQKLGLIPLDAEIYMVSSLPIDISWSICGIIALFCLLVIRVASGFAARRLAMMEPAEGLAGAR